MFLRFKARHSNFLILALLTATIQSPSAAADTLLPLENTAQALTGQKQPEGIAAVGCSGTAALGLAAMITQKRKIAIGAKIYTAFGIPYAVSCGQAIGTLTKRELQRAADDYELGPLLADLGISDTKSGLGRQILLESRGGVSTQDLRAKYRPEIDAGVRPNPTFGSVGHIPGE